MVPAERLAFMPQGESHIAEISVRIMARSVESGQMAIRDKTLRVRGAPGATGLADLAVELDLAAGTHVTAIGVRDEATREASFVSTALQIGPQG